MLVMRQTVAFVDQQLVRFGQNVLAPYDGAQILNQVIHLKEELGSDLYLIFSAYLCVPRRLSGQYTANAVNAEAQRNAEIRRDEIRVLQNSHSVPHGR